MALENRRSSGDIAQEKLPAIGAQVTITVKNSGRTFEGSMGPISTDADGRKMVDLNRPDGTQISFYLDQVTVTVSEQTAPQMERADPQIIDASGAIIGKAYEVTSVGGATNGSDVIDGVFILEHRSDPAGGVILEMRDQTGKIVRLSGNQVQLRETTQQPPVPDFPPPQLHHY